MFIPRVLLRHKTWRPCYWALKKHADLRNFHSSYPACHEEVTSQGKGINIEKSEEGPRGSYQALVQEGILREDAHQREIVERLHRLAEELENFKKPRSKSGIFGNFFGRTQSVGPRGVYLYGSVGCGKTMLMDMLYKNMSMKQKKRVHFNEFMIDVHKRVHRFKLSAPPTDHSDKSSKPLDPIPPIAADISNETWFLCFDEFQVTDVADAMILKRLFTCLFEEGVVMIATSNRHPKDLYKNGLQRSNFLPFIPILEKHCEVIHLSSGIDYRRLDLSNISSTYFVSTEPNSEQKLQQLFDLLCDNEQQVVKPREITVFGRKLTVPYACGEVAYCSFDQLCRQALGAADYIALAQTFHTIILEKVPILSPQRKVELRRFITMVDNFYDHKVRLIMSAKRPLDSLFVLNAVISDVEADNNRLLMDDLGLSGKEKSDQNLSLFTAEEEIFAIERTVSRLTEMQTKQYWKIEERNDWKIEKNENNC